MEINKNKIRRAIELLNEAGVLLREEAEKEPKATGIRNPISDVMIGLDIDYFTARLTGYVNG